jgi:hypothetical protein
LKRAPAAASGVGAPMEAHTLLCTFAFHSDIHSMCMFVLQYAPSIHSMCMFVLLCMCMFVLQYVQVCVCTCVCL